MIIIDVLRIMEDIMNHIIMDIIRIIHIVHIKPEI